jgi:hypothetical protein
VEEKG